MSREKKMIIALLYLRLIFRSLDKYRTVIYIYLFIYFTIRDERLKESISPIFQI